jgi:hypothetical protein
MKMKNVFVLSVLFLFLHGFHGFRYPVSPPLRLHTFSYLASGNRFASYSLCLLHGSPFSTASVNFLSSQSYRRVALKAIESSIVSDDSLMKEMPKLYSSTDKVQQEESWKEIEDFPNYEVSSFGNIRNRITLNILANTKTDRYGYPQVELYNNKKGHSIAVHSLVAKAFLLEVSEKPLINHIDKNRKNNHINNLRYVTKGEAQWGQRVSRRNKSGVKGVSFDETKQKWLSRIGFNKKQIYLGYYETKEAATAARKAGEMKYYGEYR